ncbi:hypothetical protein [Actinoplanes sp. CA-252034]|uniref:hypothetical protein n=1 Tax=Actinoplanes sp. CA-252034 TaxID=3239906 RepID=UPI003D98D78C
MSGGVILRPTRHLFGAGNDLEVWLSMVHPEQIVTSLLVMVTECRRGIGGFAESMWLSHDFGDGSSLTPGLEVELPDGAPGVYVGFTVSRWADSDLPGVSDDVDFELMIEVADAGFIVHSVIQALLAMPFGEYAKGSHVLYRNRSGVLDFEATLVEARAHVAALWDLDDVLPEVGFPRR